MEFEKLSAPSLKDLFVKQIQGMILSGELAQGTALPPERELARQMQVSRAVVNGGLAELAAQGFVEIRPRQGTFVADYRRNGNLSTLIAIMEYNGGTLGREEIRSILEVRRALEQLAVGLILRNATDEDIERLGDLVAHIAGAQTPQQAAERAFEFQHELALISCPRAGHHAVGALLPPLWHRGPLPQHRTALYPSEKPGRAPAAPLDRDLSGGGHRGLPANLQRVTLQFCNDSGAVR